MTREQIVEEQAQRLLWLLQRLQPMLQDSEQADAAWLEWQRSDCYGTADEMIASASAVLKVTP